MVRISLSSWHPDVARTASNSVQLIKKGLLYFRCNQFLNLSLKISRKILYYSLVIFSTVTVIFISTCVTIFLLQNRFSILKLVGNAQSAQMQLNLPLFTGIPAKVVCGSVSLWT